MKKIFLFAALAAAAALPAHADFSVKEIIPGDDNNMVVVLEDPAAPSDLYLQNATLYANGVKYPTQLLDVGLRGKQGVYTATAKATFPIVDKLDDAHIILKIDGKDFDIMMPGVTPETACAITSAQPAKITTAKAVDSNSTVSTMAEPKSAVAEPKKEVKDGKQTMFVKTDRSLGLDKPRKHYENEQLVKDNIVKVGENSKVSTAKKAAEKEKAAEKAPTKKK